MAGSSQISIEIKPSSPDKPSTPPDEDTFEINQAFAGVSGNDTRISTTRLPLGRKMSLSIHAAAAEGISTSGRRQSLSVPGTGGVEIPGGSGLNVGSYSSSTSVKQSGMRRASVSGSNPVLPPLRRPSASINGQPPPVSRNDIEAAFQELSSDGKRITKEDVTRFLEQYFPKHNDKLPKNVALLKDLQKEISKDALFTMLVRRPIKNPPFEDVFQVIKMKEGERRRNGGGGTHMIKLTIISKPLTKHHSLEGI